MANELVPYITFKNVCSDVVVVPADIIRGGKSWVGATTVAVKPGECFDVAMGYAVPWSVGNSRRPSVIERRTKLGGNMRRVVPADPAVKAAWEKAPPFEKYDARKHGNPYAGLEGTEPATEVHGTLPSADPIAPFEGV